jgi:hypothetical protein
MISESVVRSAQAMHLFYIEINIISKQTKNDLPLDLCHLEAPSGVPKAILDPKVHLKQTVHLSCLEIKTISKRTKLSFHLTNVT